MAFKFLGQRQLGKLPSRWVSTILMVAIDCIFKIARALQRLRSGAAELYRKITALWAYAHNDTETARVDRPFSWASWQRISLQALTAWMNPAPPCSGMAPTGTSCPAPWGLIYNTKDTNDCPEPKRCFDPQPQNGGDNAAWGKAMAYALLDITEFHQRKFALIHFSDKDDFWTDIFRPSRYTPGDVLSSVSTFLNGGINYAPLWEAFRLMETLEMDSSFLLYYLYRTIPNSPANNSITAGTTYFRG